MDCLSVAYDIREEFELSDGGKINLDFKGKPGTRDMVFFLCGLTAESTTGYVMNFVEHLYRGESAWEGYDVCVINYRGLGG